MGAARADTRQRVFKAALDLIRDGGPQAATVRAICLRAGMKPPTLYHHFGDLAGLQRAVADAVFAEAIGRKDPVASDDPQADIERGWDAYVAFAAAEPNFFAVMARELATSSLPPSAARALAELEENFRRLGRLRKLRFAPEIAAQMAWGGAHGVATLAATGLPGEAMGREAAEAVKRAILGAMLAEPPEER